MALKYKDNSNLPINPQVPVYTVYGFSGTKKVNFQHF